MDPSGRWNFDGGTLLASHSLLILLSRCMPTGGDVDVGEVKVGSTVGSLSLLSFLGESKGL